jgi:hypothetical protein
MNNKAGKISLIKTITCKYPAPGIAFSLIVDECYRRVNSSMKSLLIAGLRPAQIFAPEALLNAIKACHQMPASG